MMQILSSAFRVAPALLVLLLVACAAPQPEFDRDGLEEVEDLAESLANDLLAFSVAVRDRDLDTVASHVADHVAGAAFPENPPSPEHVVKWISRRHWQLGSGGEGQPRERWVAGLEAFLGRFGEIDDARFKVKGAKFSDEFHGEAKIKFFIIARNEREQREWLKGTAHIEVERELEGPWRLSLFEPDSMQSKVSEVDLFSEVAFPAGVSTLFPAFGVGKNQGFVSHGAATADVNNDGLLDLAATGVDQNYLYINEGDGTFRDASEKSLVKFAPVGSGALFLDFDNDGDSDLFFAAVGQQILLENRQVPDGEPIFWDVSEQAGVALPAVGFSAVASDINGDGLPDIYVCSYNHYGTVMPDSWHRAGNGTPNLLFVNRGDGRFSEEGAKRGVADGRWTYAAGFLDVDEDGDQDLYVANDFGENAMYRNDGESFQDVAPDLGIVDPGFGMGVSFGDYDNDGDFDLHVTNMSSTAGKRILALLYPEQHELRQALDKQAAGNSLYENAGDGTFRNVTESVGGLSGGWAFGGGFVDFDNDGWQDLYTPNGFVSGKTMKDT